MKCETFRNGLSARIDGESPGMVDRELDAHLAACAACRQWVVLAERQRRRSRLALADNIPDLSGRVVAAVTSAALAKRRSLRLTVARSALAVVAVVQLVLTLWMGIAEGLFGTRLHVDREAGAWNLALAVGLFAVAWQVRRAAGMLPLLAAAVAVMFGFEVLDLARGHSRMAALLPHVLLVLALVLVALLARGAQPTGEADVARRTAPVTPVRGGTGSAPLAEPTAHRGGPAAMARRSVA